MTDYSQGDVVLVPYPFGERAGGRKRPALVVSSEAYFQDTSQLIIAQVTSRVTGPSRPGDYHIQDWRAANLPRPALVRARLATVDASMVLRRLGNLGTEELGAALAALKPVLFVES
jgi:mRNA interferase MazF